MNKYTKDKIFTYSQNFEDVILQRVFSGFCSGTYVDVGANHPVHSSVTKALYDLGWSGINVEPVQEFFLELKKQRPRDINLQIFVGSKRGYEEFWVVPGTGLSTGSGKSQSLLKQLNEFEGYSDEVETVTLTEILSKYKPNEIHFIKIDVEGYENEVIEGLDLTIFRPWVLLVEATIPLSPDLAVLDWERKLFNHGYQEVYFDGLNKWYLADERGKLRSKFSSPPNFFDNFEFAIDAPHDNTSLLQAKIDELIRRAADLEELNAQSLQMSRQLVQMNEALTGSLSWKVTAPIRKALQALIWLTKTLAGKAFSNKSFRRALIILRRPLSRVRLKSLISLLESFQQFSSSTPLESFPDINGDTSKKQLGKP